jgi:hypothetical protein
MLVIAGCAGATLLAAAFMALYRAGPSSVTARLEEFAQDAKEQIDPDLLHSWAIDLLEAHPDGYKELSPHEIPNFLALRDHPLPEASIGADMETGEQNILILYRRRGRVGFVVGPAGMILTENGLRLLKWRDGIYFFYAPR